jgi:hypothetical protein
MDKTKGRQTRRLSVGLSEEEYAKLRKAFASSRCKTLSEYARRMLLGTAVRRRRHDDAAVLLTGELLRLRQALEKATGSLSGTTGRATPSATRNPNSYAAFQMNRMLLADKISQIERHIQKITERCIQ